MENRLTTILTASLITKVVRLVICLVAILTVIASAPSSSFLISPVFAACREQCLEGAINAVQTCNRRCPGMGGNAVAACYGGCGLGALIARSRCESEPSCNAATPEAVIDNVRESAQNALPACSFANNNGQQICISTQYGSGFVTCVNNEWTATQACGEGTRCQANPADSNRVLCGS